MPQSPLLSARLQNVLNQLEKIIDELDPSEDQECLCECCTGKKSDFLTRD